MPSETTHMMWIKKDGDLCKKHTVLDETMKRRIEKTGRNVEKQLIIGVAVANGFSTSVL
jgi:hypothetical protein